MLSSPEIHCSAEFIRPNESQRERQVIEKRPTGSFMRSCSTMLDSVSSA